MRPILNFSITRVYTPPGVRHIASGTSVGMSAASLQCVHTKYSQEVVHHEVGARCYSPWKVSEIELTQWRSSTAIGP
jgi:hypothetical protein